MVLMKCLSQMGSGAALMWDSQFTSFVILLPLFPQVKAAVALSLLSLHSFIRQDKMAFSESARMTLPTSCLLVWSFRLRHLLRVYGHLEFPRCSLVGNSGFRQWSRNNQVQILAQHFISCVTLGK